MRSENISVQEVLNIKTFLSFPRGGESLRTRLVRLSSSMLEGDERIHYSIVCVIWERYMAVAGPGNEATTSWQQKELEAHSEWVMHRQVLSVLVFLIYTHSCYSGCKKCGIPTPESGGIPTLETETKSGERKLLIPKTGGKHCSLNKAKPFCLLCHGGKD